MINEVRDTPIHRLRDCLLDVSQIWSLRYIYDNYSDDAGAVYVNGIMITVCTQLDYEDLERKFFSYRGWNYDR